MTLPASARNLRSFVRFPQERGERIRVVSRRRPACAATAPLLVDSKWSVLLGRLKGAS